MKYNNKNMACSSCNKKKKTTPIATPINDITPDGKIIQKSQTKPSENFKPIRVLPPKRG